MTLLDAQGSNGLRYDGLAGVSGTQGYGAFVDLGANACGQGLLYGTLHD